MWHEARRQERKIRGMLVDYRKRAERRRDFYEKIKADPTQFLQIHGRRCKIHLDPTVAAAADSAVMMPWQGNSDNLIDRFDVRAHLDYIPPVKKEEEVDLDHEERLLNYERYRIIAQNSFLGITEEKFLKQLHLEEQFGYTEMKGKKEQRTGGAAIGFNYEDGTGVSQTSVPEPDPESEDDNSDSDLDVDLAINVSKMEPAQAHDMNKHGRQFGMSSNDFYSFLTNDLEEAESYRRAKEEEQEKALFSGRKSRRERRYHREKRLANRVISPPSYAAQASPTLPLLRDSKSPSRSPTPDNTGKITYITSFGDEEEPQSSNKPTYADKVKLGKPKRGESSEKIIYYSRRRSRSRSRDKMRSKRQRRSRSISRSRMSKPRLKRSRSRSKRSGSPPRSDSRSIRRSSSRSKLRRSNSRSRLRRSRSKSRRSNSRSNSKRSRSMSKSRISRSSTDRYRKSRSRSKTRGASFRKKPSRSSSSSSSSTTSCKSVSQSPNKEKKNSSSPAKVITAAQPDVQENPLTMVKREPSVPKVLPRYYGRRKSDKSSSELSASDEEGGDDENSKMGNNPAISETKMGHGNSGTAIKKTTTSLTIIERLKRKRQALLNRQFKADKIAEQLKTEREKQEQQTREDELREMAIKLRRRQREKRHANDSNHSSSSSDSDTSSKSKDSITEKKAVSSRSHSPLPESRDITKRHESRFDRNKERRDSVDRRRHSRDRRDRRESSRDRRRDRRSPSPRRTVYKERWRDDREKRDTPRSGRSLVDY